MSIESTRHSRIDDPLRLARKIRERNFGAAVGSMLPRGETNLDISLNNPDYPHVDAAEPDSPLDSPASEQASEPRFGFFERTEPVRPDLSVVTLDEDAYDPKHRA